MDDKAGDDKLRADAEVKAKEVLLYQNAKQSQEVSRDWRKMEEETGDPPNSPDF